MNKDKLFEALVKLIQDTYKDSPNTTITQRERLKNKSGKKREFDIVIRTTVNDHPICIVIECRNKRGKIKVTEIEAFNSKCQRVEGINKKIFVAKSGYQDDAINAAKDFDITLYQLDELDSNILKNWIKEFNLKETITDGSITEVRIKFSDAKQKFSYNGNSLIGEENITNTWPLIHFIKLIYEKDSISINNDALKRYRENTNNGVTNSQITLILRFNLILPNVPRYFLINDNNVNCFIEFIDIKILFTIMEKILEPDSSKSFFQYSSKENKAELMSFDSVLGDNRVTVIRDPKNQFHLNLMFTNNEGGPMDANVQPFLILPEGLQVKITPTTE